MRTVIRILSPGLLGFSMASMVSDGDRTYRFVFSIVATVTIILLIDWRHQ